MAVSVEAENESRCSHQRDGGHPTGAEAGRMPADLW